jgi:hypothetical protein
MFAEGPYERAGVVYPRQGREHWFHTDEQIQFLDDWIRRKEKEWT